MHSLQDIKLLLLDMDGTFYLGDTLLPGAKELLQACAAQRIQYTFLTNNSSKNAAAYIQKLAGLGVQVQPEQMFTSGDATIEYLQAQEMPKELLVIGTESLCASFKAAGFVPDAALPKAVVLGFDTTLTYDKLCRLCDAVRAGLPYIATHPDYNCPVPGGYAPDIGATIAYVKASTGRKPDVVIGKPNAGIAKAAARRFGVKLEEICMVGDRLYTDIALGRCGVATALVLCGETKPADVQAGEWKPDFVYDNLAGLAAALRLLDKKAENR